MVSVALYLPVIDLNVRGMYLDIIIVSTIDCEAAVALVWGLELIMLIFCNI